MPENLQDPTYTYIITVETGIRQLAGTKSNVFLEIDGSYGATGTRLLGPQGKVNLKHIILCYHG